MHAIDQANRRAELYALLGDLPSRDRTIAAETVSITKCDGYELETLELDLNGIEAVPAYFVRPPSAGGPMPCVLYNHAHGRDYERGKEELLIGGNAWQAPPYAQALAGLGLGALCIDHWCFGERRGRSESAIFKELLWHGQVLWGMMVYDSLRAVDYLSGREDVDATRLATLGLSMGSTMAWWLAALDPRIAVCVDLCCLTDFHALIETQQVDLHGVYYFVPGLLNHFTTAQINALIAPRPHLSLAGVYDPLTPPSGLAQIDRELRSVYAGMGAAEAWRLDCSPTGHYETARMRQAALAWLNHWLMH